jgi:hypothetical protein
MGNRNNPTGNWKFKEYRFDDYKNGDGVSIGAEKQEYEQIDVMKKLDVLERRLERLEDCMLQARDFELSISELKNFLLEQFLPSVSPPADLEEILDKIVILNNNFKKVSHAINQQLSSTLASMRQEMRNESDASKAQLEELKADVEAKLEKVLMAIPERLDEMELEAIAKKQLITLNARTIQFTEEILKSFGDSICLGYFGTERMAKIREQFLEVQQKAQALDEIIIAILRKATKLGVAAEKFNSLQKSFEQFQAELDNALMVKTIPLQTDVISYEQYLQKFEESPSPPSHTGWTADYENYLQAIRSQYEEYFKQFADDFIHLTTEIDNAETYFAEQLEAFVTNGIVPFVYVLDDEIRNLGHPSPGSPIEEEIQKLFDFSGLKEIKVVEKADTYNVAIHEAVRWERSETLAEKLSEGTIISLVRRGFSFKNKVLRRARVVVCQ